MSNGDGPLPGHPHQFFVGGIHEDITEPDLQAFFETFGPLDLCVLKKGRSTPFGFVAYQNKDDAENVLDNYTNNKVTATKTNKDHWVDIRWCRDEDNEKQQPVDENNVGGDSTLFVGNIPEGATESEVKDFFLAYGVVKSLDLKKHTDTGKSKGFGFLEFETAAEAQGVLDQKGQIVFENNTLTLEVRNRAIGDNKEGGQKDGDPNSIFVGGVPMHIGVKELREYFSSFGECKIDLKMNPATQKHRGYGFVIMNEKSVAEAVIACGDHQIDGQRLDVKGAKHGVGKYSDRDRNKGGKGKGYDKGGKGSKGKGGGYGGGWDNDWNRDGWGNGGDSWGNGNGGGYGKDNADRRFTSDQVQTMMGLMTMMMGMQGKGGGGGGGGGSSSWNGGGGKGGRSRPY